MMSQNVASTQSNWGFVVVEIFKVSFVRVCWFEIENSPPNIFQISFCCNSKFFLNLNQIATFIDL